MSTEIKVPALPESVVDAVVATWHVKVGDAVSAGDQLVDLETDKVMLEVPAPADGVVGEIFVEAGVTVTADTVLATFNAGASAAEPVAQAAPVEASPTPESSKISPTVEKHHAQTLSPSVRRALDAHGMDPQSLQGTGKAGRLTREDVERGANSVLPQGTMASARSEKRVPMSRMRARIAERLLAAKNETAMLTTFNEINMQPVMAIRARYKDAFLKKHDVKLGFMSFFIKAVVTALKRFPAINASIDGSDIVYHEYYDIGVAISSPRGLVVPVLRDVEHMRLADIEKGIIHYAQRAKDNKMTIEDMTGGTFTVTNGGVFGSMLSTPLLNPPQCAILGMHNIVKRAVVVDDAIVIRPMMYVALSYDHQLVDGRESVQFLVTIKELLEHPERFLLDL